MIKYFFRCSDESKEPTSPKELCNIETKLPSNRGKLFSILRELKDMIVKLQIFILNGLF